MRKIETLKGWFAVLLFVALTAGAEGWADMIMGVLGL